MMKIRVRFFGQEAQLAGRSSVDLELPDAATCADLRVALLAAVPSLAGMLQHCRIAINHAFAREDQPLRTEDELALIGLVSGG